VLTGTAVQDIRAWPGTKVPVPVAHPSAGGLVRLWGEMDPTGDGTNAIPPSRFSSVDIAPRSPVPAGRTSAEVARVMQIQTQAVTPDPLPRRRRRRLLAVLLGLAVATTGAGVFSLAVFTSSQASTGAFTTGTIVLGVNPATMFTVAGILPGDSGSQTVTVSNTGTGALRYAMSSVSTNADTKNLRSQLQLTVKTGACAGTTSVYSGTLNGAAIGDPTQGAQAGDRTLASGTNEQLCFAWSLPLATGDAFQGATTTTTFTFAAEQTQNNP